MKFGKTARLLAMLMFTASFFLVEIVVGYISHSMALVADSFHMLSDVMALLVAFLSVRISKQKSTKNTFGWARAEVMGALVNSVFLLALCFSIFVEACERLHDKVKIHDPKMVLIVGCLGLGVNLVGLFLFHQHSHGHSHSHESEESLDHHGKHAESHRKDKAKYAKEAYEAAVTANGHADAEGIRLHQTASQEHPLLDGGAPNGGVYPDGTPMEPLPEPKIASSSQLNMRGVFLHVLGDALGSLVVIVSALIIWFTEWEYEDMIDPAMSILMVFIISYTTIPLLKESALILMQTVPTHIEIEDIKKRLLQIDGVLAVHELHIWQLAGDRIIASAHIRCHNLQEYMRVAVKIKRFFHCEGIHSTTMQPEFEEPPMPGLNGEILSTTTSACILPCPEDSKNCGKAVCCVTPKGPVIVTNSPSVPGDVDQRARDLERMLTERRTDGLNDQATERPSTNQSRSGMGAEEDRDGARRENQNTVPNRDEITMEVDA